MVPIVSSVATVTPRGACLSPRVASRIGRPFSSEASTTSLPWRELSEMMARAVALDDSDLVLDLSDVQFMDAATINVLIRSREFLRARSRSLVLTAPSTSALRVIRACGLDHLIEPGPAAPARRPWSRRPCGHG